MDTKRLSFLKQCRKEKNLTQEQLAEKFEYLQEQFPDGNRNKYADLSILVQLAEYYDVEMGELPGWRKEPDYE